MTDPGLSEDALIEKEFNENATELIISEANMALEAFLEKKRQLDPDYQPSEVFEKFYKYTKAFGQDFSVEEILEQVRQRLEQVGMTKHEIAMIGSLVPESAEQAKKYLEPLERIPDEELEDVLKELRSLKAMCS
ncbi:unnamed protein product [Pedinophyceae sp. YPF-701]|nr:unnamed protein product [Pedinophyceae sp. YPF-701]